MTATASDTELLQQCIDGDKDAFGLIVSRYQNLVCSVAYSVVGDFTRSEDIGQETFVTAWKQLASLKDVSKFRSWISTIARNCALTFLRRERSSAELPDNQSIAADDPAETAITLEEQDLVWTTLEGLPENYREPMVLYYRQDCSVADVAASMDLTEATVRQRLSRGRELLRTEIAGVVERTLRATVPGAAFTLAVMGGISGVGTATASAAVIGSTGKAAAPIVVAAAKTGLLAAIAGTLLGVVGACLGPWLTVKNVRFQRERDVALNATRNILILTGLFVLPFVGFALGWSPWQNNVREAGFGIMVWILTYIGLLLIYSIRTVQRWKQVVEEEIAAGTQPLPSGGIVQWLKQWEGRHWTSKTKLLGLPLFQIAMANPEDQWRMPSQKEREESRETQIARAWIAVGEVAYGVLLAIGGRAAGTIAMGGIATGVFAFGGIGIGIITFGGLAVGLLSFGACSVGVWAYGATAMGWMAMGAFAIAWKAAVGAFAISYEYAVGEQTSFARHANDAAARQIAETSDFFQSAQMVQNWLAEAGPLGGFGLVLCVSLLPAAVLILCGYRRRKTAKSPMATTST